jgi:2-oxoisovalerate dehydrogenase E1 component alpha subunit
MPSSRSAPPAAKAEAIGTLGQSRPSVKTMFEDVYSTDDWRIREQRQEVGV